MFSVILRPQVEPGILGGLAVLLSGEAAKVLQDLTHLPIKVKWPNDIIYEDRKLGGLIIEGAARRSDADVFILGAGININVRSRDFPGEIRRTAASVRDIAGEEVDEERLLALILRSFERLYGAILRRGTSPYLRSMRNISTLGRKVRIETEKETVTGTALRLTDRGALVMRIDGGMEREFLSALKLTEL
jgi:BirA family biotin operon repressor/biotin-[acetyl-CoA-carboxylase] ligase